MKEYPEGGVGQNGRWSRRFIEEISSEGIITNYNTGDTVYASTNPPTRRTPGDGCTWVQVTIFDGSVGWVTEFTANGQIQDISPISCP